MGVDGGGNQGEGGSKAPPVIPWGSKPRSWIGKRRQETSFWGCLVSSALLLLLLLLLSIIIEWWWWWWYWWWWIFVCYNSNKILTTNIPSLPLSLSPLFLSLCVYDKS
jgi:hypothetical protein